MLMRLAIGVLQLVVSSFSFDTTSITNTPETKKCYTCSVFTFIDNRLLCTNPGTCYSDYCYSYVLSDLRSMYLSGCAEDWSDFPFRSGHDDRTLCHAHGHVGLCLCQTGNTPCNKIISNDTELQWISSDILMMNSVSHKVTGFLADYARKRVVQMRVDSYPETFPGTPLNSAWSSYSIVALIVGSLAIVHW
ncbi:hypothetical protein Y032_0032g2471 [Ancylostoma ceylanicum]|uniref:Uncharacterized protein n=2 Tax=Ancylostoma ceylanicum TaxID=53326 RepID=A0A016UPE8_9BILA|nr:hypothetical protein Y032_0032g2471 [Ancylostoma ceylanicum]